MRQPSCLLGKTFLGAAVWGEHLPPVSNPSSVVWKEAQKTHWPTRIHQQIPALVCPWDRQLRRRGEHCLSSTTPERNFSDRWSWLLATMETSQTLLMDCLRAKGHYSNVASCNLIRSSGTLASSSVG